MDRERDATAMLVPVANIYYLLCYAWDQLGARDLIDVNSIHGDRAENLPGKAMQTGVARLLRQGLDRGYVAVDQEGRHLRGKLLLTETLSRALLPSGRVACTADDLTYDVPHNRVVKGAMCALIGIPELDPNIRLALGEHCRRMSEINDIEFSLRAFRNVQLHRNAARYAFLVHVAYLIAQSFIPERGRGRARFRPFTASQQAMGRLFERFVRNFLRREQDRYTVGAAIVPWHVDAATEADRAWLPDMRTDVMLTHPSRRLVIETKYYATPYQRYHERKKIISHHLYQLLGYMTNLRSCEKPDPIGMLLYARVGEDYEMDYELSGHRVMVRTLNLGQNWEDIHRDLLALVEAWCRCSAIAWRLSWPVKCDWRWPACKRRWERLWQGQVSGASNRCCRRNSRARKGACRLK